MEQQPDKINNKRLAKNTLMLYFRMILIMAVTLYTSRVVLSILGVTDYGIYNVVAGVVTMLGMLSGSMALASSRFITYEIGRGGQEIEKIFRCSATVHYILALIVFVVGESIGVWFVMHKLVIPPDRLTAAFWVFQCAIAAVVIRIISTPYNAIIIAYEKMSAFAYISLFEVALQLALIFSLKLLPDASDKLIFYGLFLALTQILVRMVYNIYCKRKIKGTNGRWLWHKETSRQILKFAGWTMTGSIAVAGYTQGINILLNLFYGPIANAARGFSNQIETGLTQLSSNFQMALQPATIKAHAQDKLNDMHRLMIANAKYSYYLVLIMVVPIMISTPYILKLWLAEVPQYTVDFTRLTLLGTLYVSIKNHTNVAVHATGDVKKFQIVEGLLLLTTLPIAYILLKYFNLSANGVIVVYLVIQFITQFVRVHLVYPMVKLSRKAYLTKICLPLVLVSIPVTAYTLYAMAHLEARSFPALLGSVGYSIMFCLIVIALLGLSGVERRFIMERARKILRPIMERARKILRRR